MARTFRSLLREKLDELGASGNDLAVAMTSFGRPMSKWAVHKWLQGETVPTQARWATLFEALGLSTEEQDVWRAAIKAKRTLGG